MEYTLDHQKEYQDYIGNWLRTVKWFVWTSKALRVIPHSTFRKKNQNRAPKCLEIREIVLNVENSSIYNDLKYINHNIIHLLTGYEGNSTFIVPKVPTIFRGNAKENIWHRGDN